MTTFSLSDGTHIFYIASNQHIDQLFFNKSTFAWTNQDITVTIGGALADSGSGLVSCTLADGDHIFYVDVNQHVNQLYYNPTTNGWSNTDITVASSSPVAILHSSLTVMPLSDGDHVFYIDANQHIDQIWNSGSSWLTQNLGHTAVIGSALASCSQADGDHIFYINVNEHVNQLFFNTSSYTWSNQDVTAASSAPSAVDGSTMAVMSLSDGDHIFYISPNHHVNQLFFNESAFAWSSQDVTASSSAPVASEESALTSCNLSDGDHIFYVDLNQHVNQLWFNQSAYSWSDQDLTAMTGSGNAAAGTALTIVAESDGDHVFYVSLSLQVSQLWFNESTYAWTDQNLTSSANGPSAMVFYTVAAGGSLSPLTPAKEYLYLNGKVFAIEHP